MQLEAVEPHELLLQLRMDLDKSLLTNGAAQPLMAKRLLGPRWRLTPDKLSISNDTSGKTLFTLADYKKQLNIA